MPPKAAAVLMAAFLFACSVRVIDRTSSPLTYNTPVNEQTFRVEVKSNSTVRRVELTSTGAGTAPMTLDPSTGLYDVQMSLPTCANVAEFTVDVTVRAEPSDRTYSFPESGKFTHAIFGQPTACGAFSGSFARTFVVDATEDFVDDNPGDGECRGTPATDLQGPCSLRAAVMEANASAGADLIRVPARRYVLTIPSGGESTTAVDASVGDLDVTESVTIEGIAGTTARLTQFTISDATSTDYLADDPNSTTSFVKVDGNQVVRGFHVTGSETVLRLRQLAVTGGFSAGKGGALYNQATTTLERVAFVGNRGEATTSAKSAGAVHNEGTLFGTDVAFTRNVGRGRNPGGGAIVNSGTVRLDRALFAFNDARFGAAILDWQGGKLTLENATFFSNEYRDIIGGTLSVLSVQDDESQADLAYVTFSGHQLNERRMISVSEGGAMTMRNSLIAGNVANACTGPIESKGGNVSDIPCSMTSGLFPDHIDVGPVGGIGSAGDLRVVGGGGFTPVVSIAAPTTSSRFNAVDRAQAPPHPFSDQRGPGYPRAVDADGDGHAVPDPGAFEYQP